MTINLNIGNKFIKTNQVQLNKSTASNQTNSTLNNTVSNNAGDITSELWNSLEAKIETDAAPKAGNKNQEIMDEQLNSQAEKINSSENVIDGGSIPGIYVDRVKAKGCTHVFSHFGNNYVEVVHSDLKVTKGHFEYNEDHTQGKGVDDEVFMASGVDYDDLKSEIGASHITTSVPPSKLYTSSFITKGGKYVEVKESYSKITTGHFEYNEDHTIGKGVDDNVKYELPDGTKVKP